jgi:hypothetical protein
MRGSIVNTRKIHCSVVDVLMCYFMLCRSKHGLKYRLDCATHHTKIVSMAHPSYSCTASMTCFNPCLKTVASRSTHKRHCTSSSSGPSNDRLWVSSPSGQVIENDRCQTSYFSQRTHSRSLETVNGALMRL